MLVRSGARAYASDYLKIIVLKIRTLTKLDIRYEEKFRQFYIHIDEYQKCPYISSILEDAGGIGSLMLNIIDSDLFIQDQKYGSPLRRSNKILAGFFRNVITTRIMTGYDTRYETQFNLCYNELIKDTEKHADNIIVLQAVLEYAIEYNIFVETENKIMTD